MADLELGSTYFDTTQWLAGLNPEEVRRASLRVGPGPAVLARLAAYPRGTRFWLRSDTDSSRFLTEDYLTQTIESFFEVLTPDRFSKEVYVSQSEIVLLDALQICHSNVVCDCMTLSEEASSIPYIIMAHIHSISNFMSFELIPWFDPNQPFTAGELAAHLLESSFVNGRTTGQMPLPIHPLDQKPLFVEIWGQTSIEEKRIAFREIALIADNSSFWVFEPISDKPIPPQAKLSLFDQFLRLALSYHPEINSRSKLKTYLSVVEEKCLENPDEFLSAETFSRGLVNCYDLDFISFSTVLERIRIICERKLGSKEPSKLRYVVMPKLLERDLDETNKPTKKKKPKAKKKKTAEPCPPQGTAENFVVEHTENEFFEQFSNLIVEDQPGAEFEVAVRRLISSFHEPRYEPNVPEEVLLELFEPNSSIHFEDNRTDATDLAPGHLSVDTECTVATEEPNPPEGSVIFIEEKKSKLRKEERSKKSQGKRSANVVSQGQGCVNTRKRRSQRVRPAEDRAHSQQVQIVSDPETSPVGSIGKAKRQKLNYNPKLHSFDPFQDFSPESIVKDLFNKQVTGLATKMSEYANSMALANHNFIFFLEQLISKSLPRKFHISIFGSFATGLFTPLSDIDLAIESDPPARTPLEAASLLRTIVDSLKVAPIDLEIVPILSASIPVAKKTCEASFVDPNLEGVKIHCDLSAIIKESPDQTCSSAATTSFLIKAIKENPHFSTIVCLLKYSLGCQGLINTYKGGINSFGLALICLAGIRHMKVVEIDSLGEAFRKVLTFIARIFKSDSQMIDLNDKSILLTKSLDLDIVSNGLIVFDPTLSKPRNVLPSCHSWQKAVDLCENVLAMLEAHVSQVKQEGDSAVGEERLTKARSRAGQLMKHDQGDFGNALFEILKFNKF